MASTDDSSARTSSLLSSAEAYATYEKWREAHEQTQLGNSFSIGDHSVTRADDDTIRYWMGYWLKQARALEDMEKDNPPGLPGVKIADFRYGPT